MTAAIPEGLEPLGVWDTREHSLTRMIERSRWAVQHIPRADDTYRAEFHLIDAPCAVLYRHRRNADGRLYNDPETGEIATEPPVIVPLEELPPGRLLRTSCGQCGRTGTASRDVVGDSTLYSWPYDGAERYICRGPCQELDDDGVAQDPG